MAETGMERVALRIWHERAKHFGEPATPFVKDERWELCLSYARAAIEEIRTPTEEMCDAGAEALDTYDPADNCPGPQSMARGYTAMIDSLRRTIDRLRGRPVIGRPYRADRPA